MGWEGSTQAERLWGAPHRGGEEAKALRGESAERRKPTRLAGKI